MFRQILRIVMSAATEEYFDKTSNITMIIYISFLEALSSLGIPHF